MVENINNGINFDTILPYPCWWTEGRRWVEWEWKEPSTGGGVAATKTKHNKRGGGYLITSWAGGARDMWRRRREAAPASTAPQVGHHPELLAQQHQHLLEQGWRPSTNSFTPVTSFYKCGGVLIPEVQLQLLQDQHTPSLRGCSRVAWQAPMWVVVRPAR